MAWVGGANEASGATSTLTGALNGIAGNIDTIATVAGALVGVGLARYFGGLTTSVTKATIGVAGAAKGEVALAQAQLRGTQIAVARARAAEYRAQNPRLLHAEPMRRQAQKSGWPLYRPPLHAI